VNAARLSILAACACWLLAWAMPVAAEERITRYDIQVGVQSDGSLEVTERIDVRAEGQRIRRGIYRDFPTRYRDRHGNRIVVGFEVLEVQRDGRPEPWFTESFGNGVRLNTGNDDLLPTPASLRYTLRYRTTRQLGFFDAHDELYWNAIGTGWEFPIDAGNVEVRLPQPVPQAQLQLEAYTGAQGARGRAYEAMTPAPGVARWRLAAPLAPGEGLTIVLGFPKGVVQAPGRAQQLRWLLADNRALLIASSGLLVLLAWCGARWHAVGRDPAPGTVVVRYTPPPGISPAGLRHIRRMGYDHRCFTADVLALAVAGELRIERDKRLLKDRWQLHRAVPATGSAAPVDEACAALLEGLFADSTSLALDSAAASRLQTVIRAHTAALDRRFRGTMFRHNGGSSLVALLIAVLFSAAALVLGQGHGLLFALVPIALMVATLVAFAFLVRAPTPEGRLMLDQIEGLRRYLGVAERQDLQRLAGPDEAEPALDAQRFEALLPYAVALDVEEAWTKKFTLAVGAAAAATATSSMAWYHGSGRGPVDIAGFTRSIGSGLTSQIASSSTPPGSSSGGGGGGFSGGGGGGGGGGGR